MTERNSLLKRYGIPLNHLDFQYIQDCDDPREIEKITHVLQSGEEGYYPDLTKCAEDKLRQLKPQSRLFRCEVPLLRAADINKDDLLPIEEFTRTAHVKDQCLAALKDENKGLAPIRSAGKINLNKTEENESSNLNTVRNQSNTNRTPGKKTTSTDYRKWDRYDPDEEILRMDLAEERKQEEIEIKHRLNEKTFSKAPLIEEISAEEERIKKFTDIERESLAEEYRLRGNEYFRAKEYDSALVEYTKTITLNPERDAAAYNNRAMTYMKLKKYADAIKDCEKCLSIEPNNIKALYRLGQSNMESGCKEKALETFEKILELDSKNTNAINCVQKLRNEIPQIAPSNATRLRITEGPSQQCSTTVQKTVKSSNESQKVQTKKIKSPKNSLNTEMKSHDYDLASIVRPKEIVPTKWINNAANFIDKNDSNCDKNMSSNIRVNNKDNDENEIKLRLSMPNEAANSKVAKPLIEEL